MCQPHHHISGRKAVKDKRTEEAQEGNQELLKLYRAGDERKGTRLKFGERSTRPEFEFS